MPKIVAKLCATLLFATASSGAMAQSMTWRISEAAGAVSVRRGAELRPAVRDAVLAPGDAVVTGAGGRAVLVHDRDFVTVSANSRVTVPAAQEASGFTQIIQNIGNAIFRIEKLKSPHFGVKTPYLAAVVKGTTFSVTVDGTGTSLQVVEGAVEVATLDGGAKDLIRPGAVATIGAGDLFRLQVQGDSARTIDSPARPAEAPAAATPAALAPSIEPGPAPVQPSDVVAADSGRQTIGEAISSKPIDLASITGGMMTGSTAAAPAMLVAAVKLETATLSPTAPTGQPAPPPVTVTDTSPVVVAEVPVTSSPAKTDPVGTASTSDSSKADAAGSKPAKDTGTTAANADKGGHDPKTPGDDLTKAQDRAARDAEKAARDAEKDDKVGKDGDKAIKDAAKNADDAKKAADDAAKQAAKDADDAKKAADDAAKQAAKDADDAKKAADDAAKQAAKDADDAKKAADDAAKQAAKDAEDAKAAADDAAKDAAKVLEDAAKAAAKAEQDAIDVAAEGAKTPPDKLPLPLPSPPAGSPLPGGR